jgi:hypothetical protein
VNDCSAANPTDTFFCKNEKLEFGFVFLVSLKILFSYIHETSKVGDFCLAVVLNKQVLHHKIDSKKLRPPFGSVADFVRNKRELTKVVVPFVLLENGTLLNQAAALEKEAALTEFYAPLK